MAVLLNRNCVVIPANKKLSDRAAISVAEPPRFTVGLSEKASSTKLSGHGLPSTPYSAVVALATPGARMRAARADC